MNHELHETTIADTGVPPIVSPNMEPGSDVHETEVTESDVLSGRGNGVAGHEGNVFYTRLIKDNKEEYQGNTSGKTKRQIALRIIDIIKAQDPPGRFLKSKKDEPFVWSVQEDSVAIKKVTQALREKPKLKKKASRDSSVGAASAKENRLQSFRNSLRTSRKRDNFNRSQEHLLDGPTKKSIVGSSRRILSRWMYSMSKLNLLNTSLEDIKIPHSEIEPPVKDDVLMAMEQLSGQPIDEGCASVTNTIGCRLDALLANAIPSAKSFGNDNLRDGGIDEMSEEFIGLMETSVRSLLKTTNSTRSNLKPSLSATSYEHLAKEMNQALTEELHHLHQELEQKSPLAKTCLSSKSLLTGSISLMSGGMDDVETNEELRDVLLQLATDSVQSSMGKLDICSAEH